MRAPRLTPSTYRALTFAALVSLVAIVITGALVRLTDSGMGCEDWPNCSKERFIDVSSTHAAIEQLNRLFTGVVSAAVILAVAGALVRRPRRRDLTWLSLSLVGGVIAQVLVGALVIATDLHPAVVQQHFLVSMVLLATGLTLHRRAALADGERWVPAVDRTTMRHVWAVAGLATSALVTGTLVTGTGPHSGMHDGEPVQRFGWAITSVARVHSVTVIVTMAVTLLLVWQARRAGVLHRIENALTSVLFLGFVQGTVGYVQYFSDVPVVLVGLHVGLATLVWLAVVNLVIATRAVAAQPADARRGPSGVGAEGPADLVELGDRVLDDLAHGAH